jgi:rod shape-determining protein MreC
MRNLIVFLARNYFTLMFLLLEVVAVLILVRSNPYQRAEAVNSTSEVAGEIYAFRNDLTGYFNLRDQNRILSEEIARLRNQKTGAWLITANKEISVNDTLYRQLYSFIDAEVIDNTVTRRNNYIILSRGKNQGVREGMGVIGPGGIVGIVRSVSPNFCTVMSLLHKDSRISASLKKDGTFAQLLWEGGDYRTATLKEIPTHVKLLRGDTLVTSGLGNAFPKGVLVGVIASYEKKAGEKTYTAQVMLGTDFRKLQHASIVNNLMKDELEQLQRSIPEDDGK